MLHLLLLAPSPLSAHLALDRMVPVLLMSGNLIAESEVCTSAEPGEDEEGSSMLTKQADDFPGWRLAGQVGNRKKPDGKVRWVRVLRSDTEG